MQTIFVVDDAGAAAGPWPGCSGPRGTARCARATGWRRWRPCARTTPDLILLDLSMPAMDGIQFLKAINGDPKWAALPVIVVSGEASGSPLREAEELGAKEVLVKANFTPEQLLASIRRHLHA